MWRELQRKLQKTIRSTTAIGSNSAPAAYQFENRTSWKFKEICAFWKIGSFGQSWSPSISQKIPFKSSCAAHIGTAGNANRDSDSYMIFSFPFFSNSTVSEIKTQLNAFVYLLTSDLTPAGGLGLFSLRSKWEFSPIRSPKPLPALCKIPSLVSFSMDLNPPRKAF